MLGAKLTKKLAKKYLIWVSLHHQRIANANRVYPV